MEMTTESEYSDQNIQERPFFRKNVKSKTRVLDSETFVFKSHGTLYVLLHVLIK